jgi:hypothetical protein
MTRFRLTTLVFSFPWRRRHDFYVFTCFLYLFFSHTASSTILRKCWRRFIRMSPENIVECKYCLLHTRCPSSRSRCSPPLQIRSLGRDTALPILAAPSVIHLSLKPSGCETAFRSPSHAGLPCDIIAVGQPCPPQHHSLRLRLFVAPSLRSTTLSSGSPHHHACVSEGVK